MKRKKVASYSIDPAILQEFNKLVKQTGVKASPVIEALMLYAIERREELKNGKS